MTTSIESASAAQQRVIRTQAAFAIAAKQLKVTKQQGEAAAQLVEAAAQLSKELGKGGLLDALA
jgi:SpoU rRNA methylase family enzyme